MSLRQTISPGNFHPDFPHDSRGAGEVLGKSVYWIRNTRQADCKRIAEGKEPRGPVWHYDPAGNPCYLHKDLIDYIRSNYVRALPTSGSAETSNRLNPEDNPPPAA